MAEYKKNKLEILQKKSKIDSFHSQAEYSKINKIYIERLERLSHIDMQIAIARSELTMHIRDNEISSLFSGSGKIIDRYEKKKIGIEKNLVALEQKRIQVLKEYTVAEERFEQAREKLLQSHTKSSVIGEKIEHHRIREKEKSIYHEELVLHDIAKTLKSKN